MQCYTELVPPTAVNASICLPFLSSTANNLIVSKSSLLQIFALKSVIVDVSHVAHVNGAGTRSEKKERVHTTKLVLLSQVHLSGTITHLARIKALRSKSGGELLLVALKDAKLSLVEWDPEKHSISTVSIHYYERDDLQGSPWAPGFGQCDNRLTVDAASRCAAFKFGARNLAILPFHQAGDDLIMDDMDVDGGHKLNGRSAVKVNGDVPSAPTPYSTSFVLSLLKLDPELRFPIDLAFLQGYRDPTLSVLSSPIASSAALIKERRDPVTFTVYTLDLDQRASTTLLSVADLPYDLFKIIPLPNVIGGALLVGYNELIHVDQAGKTHGVAINEFSQRCTSFPLTQQADLGLKLEGCVIEQLGASSSEMLIVLNNGELAILSFRLDGRNVAGLSVHKVAEPMGGFLLPASASCASVVGRGRMFLGSEESDAVVLGWSSLSSRPTKNRTKPEAEEEDGDMDVDSAVGVEDGLDLYADDSANKDASESTKIVSQASEDYSFRVHDTLPSLAPLRDVRLATAKDGSSGEEREDQEKSLLNLCAVAGSGKTSSLVHLSPEVRLSVLQASVVKGVQKVWTLRAEAQDTLATANPTEAHNVLVTSTTNAETPESRAYRIQNQTLVEFDSSDFETDAGASIEVASFLGGTRVVQVLSGEVRVFDSDFNLAQIVPLSEDENNPQIVAASIVEPFVVLLRDDSSVIVLKSDESGDLEELEGQDQLASKKWCSASLYDDVMDAFHLEADAGDDEEDYSSMLLFLLDIEGGLQIYHLPRLDLPVYNASGLAYLPPYLSSDFNLRRSSAKAQIAEILVAELGDPTLKIPHLILRSTSDDLILYSPYQDISKSAVVKTLQFRKIYNPYLPKANLSESDETTTIRAPLRVIAAPGGKTCVIAPGHSTSIIIKSASSDAIVLAVKPAVMLSASGYVSSQGTGIACVSEGGEVSFLQLPVEADYTSGWSRQYIISGPRIPCFEYNARVDRYVVAVSETIPFRLPDDELHPEWLSENASLYPMMERDIVKLIDATTLGVTDTFELEPQEVVTCIQTMSLVVSETTHERRSVVCVGTAITRGEDINTFGCIYVLDIIEVVPEPDHPETSRKFKMLAKVRDKGAVTAITQIGTEGFLLVAQGQKCHVRGLKEDGTLLPVAFLDTQCYVAIAKELPGTGLTMLGDAFKGLWFVGYTQDPYHLKMFGKAERHLEVITASYLPDSKDLYLVVVDASRVLHVYQFDPSNPKSLSGHNLLHVSSFNAGAFPSGSLLLPRTSTSWEQLLSSPTPDDDDTMDTNPDTPASASHQVLFHNDDGSISLLTPLPSAKYRALGALQSYLNTTLPHPLGLNPKAYRNIDADLSVGGRAVLDGNILRRWMELGAWKRAESVARAGLEGEWELRALLDGVGGRGLGYI